MGIKLPERAIKLIEGKNFGHLATLMRDGSPQVTPVWLDREGDFILVNSIEGRTKPRNLARDKRVAICISNQENPYEMVTFRGKVIALTNDGAEAHIDKMAKKYIGQDKYPYGKPGDKRVIAKIEPIHASSWPPELFQGSS